MNSVQVILLSIAFVLFLFSIVCALAETSFVKLNRIRAMALEDEGHRGAMKLRIMHEHPETTLNILLLIVLVTQLGTASIISIVVENEYGTLGVAISIFAQITVFFVLGEVAPKTYAVQHPDKVALLLTPFLWIITKFAPLRWLARGLIGLSNILMPGKGIKEGPFVTEDDVKTMANVAAQELGIEHEERELIHSIFDFTDTVVREVMTPRTDMIAVSESTTITTALNLSIEQGFSRLPIYSESHDTIVGLIYMKDLVEQERDGKGDARVSTVKRTAVFIPEQKRTAELLRDMQQGQFHMAIVVDEYGGTAGLVTLEDLIEEIVGDISDEYDAVEPTIEELGDNQWRVPGRTSVDDLSDLVGAEVPDTEWDTVSGLVFNVCQHVPYEGEVVNYNNLTFMIERVQGQRIVSVRVTKNIVDEDGSDNPSQSPDASMDYTSTPDQS
ncbi:MAG TPA: hemolysin family protein [Acidimicrobiia bacterium]|nr:hemolysin family protein [Acidimicrobiia bacterium]